MTDLARYISISELAHLLNLTLDQYIGSVHFEGEISELTLAGSGHLYCTLKDEEAEIRAVLWASTVRELKFRPLVGMAVRCRGRANVYQKAGRLQMIVASMIPAGAGLLQKKFLELKAKLEGEGLFAPERKRNLPFLPRAIGLVTSGEGAAVHDIMVRLRERMPQIPVYLVNVRVQGPGAAQDIADGLRFIAESGLVDVIICGRGGGSLEDLWAFNEELVVRAIFGSRIPVVSAVGHEVDVTLADLVADVRAPTPTAAAEMVVPKRADLVSQIEDLSRRLEDYQVWFAPLGQRVDDLVEKLEGGLATLIGNSRLRLAAAGAKVDALEPRHLLGSLLGKIDVLRERLGAAALRDLNVARNRIDRLCASLRQASPEQKVSVSHELVRRLEGSLVSAFRHRVLTQRQHLQNLACRFEAASPQAVLRRGFSIVTHGRELIKSVQQVAVSDELRVSFSDGGVNARVLSFSDGGAFSLERGSRERGER